MKETPHPHKTTFDAPCFPAELRKWAPKDTAMTRQGGDWEGHV